LRHVCDVDIGELIAAGDVDHPFAVDFGADPVVMLARQVEPVLRHFLAGVSG
jgi:hypothetical protein